MAPEGVPRSAGGGNRTLTGRKPHGILSPARLPVSPLRQWRGGAASSRPALSIACRICEELRKRLVFRAFSLFLGHRYAIFRRLPGRSEAFHTALHPHRDRGNRDV